MTIKANETHTLSNVIKLFSDEYVARKERSKQFNSEIELSTVMTLNSWQLEMDGQRDEHEHRGNENRY